MCMYQQSLNGLNRIFILTGHHSLLRLASELLSGRKAQTVLTIRRRFLENVNTLEKIFEWFRSPVPTDSSVLEKKSPDRI